MYIKKYLSITKAHWQQTFNFRTDFFAGRIRSLVIICTLLFLYNNVYNQNTQLAGLNQNQVITYVFLTTIFYNFVFVYSDNAIAGGIASGKLNFYLIKPVSFVLFEFFKTLGTRILNIFFAIFDLLIVYIFFKPTLFINLQSLPLVIFALLGCSVMFYIFNLYAGIFAFTLFNAYGPRFLLRQFLELFTGRFFPLSILPSSLVSFLKVTPFWFIMYFPTQIYFNQLNLNQIAINFFYMFVWIGFLSILFKFFWQKQIKQYEGYGI